MDPSAAWTIFCTVCGVGTLLSLAVYVLPLIYLTFIAREQNLREKYGDWAVVTGGSSGIGKAVVRRLAAQGINICIAALDDDMLKTAHAELQKEFPSVQIRAVPVNLGADPETYTAAVAAATEDVKVSILVNNAGYLLMGFFERRPIEEQMANVECNALAAIRLTHHFYKKMIDQDIKGCITFTSSAACFMTCPFASMYGATKAMLSHFASSLAVEASVYGIDVTIFHPSYTHSNLFAKTPKFGMVVFLSKFGWTPADVADVMMKGAGRTVVRDLGMYAVITNLLGRFLDCGFLAKSIMPFVESIAPPGSLPNKADKKSN